MTQPSKFHFRALNRGYKKNALPARLRILSQESALEQKEPLKGNISKDKTSKTQKPGKENRNSNEEVKTGKLKSLFKKDRSPRSSTDLENSKSDKIFLIKKTKNAPEKGEIEKNIKEKKESKKQKSKDREKEKDKKNFKESPRELPEYRPINVFPNKSVSKLKFDHLPNDKSNHGNHPTSYHPQACELSSIACRNLEKGKHKPKPRPPVPEVPKNCGNDLVDEYDAIMDELLAHRQKLINAIAIYEANVCNCNQNDCGCFQKPDNVCTCPCESECTPEDENEKDHKCEPGELESYCSQMPALLEINKDKPSKCDKFREVAGKIIENNRKQKELCDCLKDMCEGVKKEHSDSEDKECKQHSFDACETDNKVIINIRVKRTKATKENCLASGQSHTDKAKRHAEKCHHKHHSKPNRNSDEGEQPPPHIEMPPPEQGEEEGKPSKPDKNPER